MNEDSLSNQFYCRYYRWLKRKARELDPEHPRKHLSQFSLKDKTEREQKALVEQWAQEMKPPDNLVSYALSRPCRPRGAATKKETRMLEAFSVMLTYNGDWGLMDIEVGARPQPVDEKKDLDFVDNLSANLRCHPNLIDLWADFVCLVKNFQARYHADTWAASFEISTQTLFEENQLRVHGHMFLNASSKIRVRSAEALAFKGVKPHRASDMFFSASRSRAGSRGAGMYYLLAPKVGSIFSEGSKRPHKDFQVNPAWITAMLSASKMRVFHCRQEYIAQARDLTRLLDGLARYEKEKQNTRVQERLEADRRALALARRPSRRLPAVDAWVRLHEENLWRYPFLVLTGPSQTGKTQFATGLVGEGEALDLNMAAAPEPDLKCYDPERHRLILFDECSASQILKQKKLFQAPPVPVSLGNSATNMYSYEVLVHKKLLVVCTNRWEQDVWGMPMEDRNWLLDNALVIRVEEPLWIP